MPPKKVLIVDDDPTFVKLVNYHLTTAGYEATSTHDGVEALSKIAKELPDLIILDVLMPVMNGFQFIEKVRENEQMRRIPVLVVSVKGSMKDFFSKLYVQDFISKPLNPQELMTKVEKVIGKAV